MDFNRRSFLTLLSLSPFANLLAQTKAKLILNKIPNASESIPAIGMGTWRTFNIGSSPKLLAKRTEILQEFFNRGGGMIDSSPMYGSAQKVVGHCLQQLKYPKTMFSADKIWTSSTSEGKEQFEEMKELWGVDSFDLMQIHNLVNWEAHYETIQKLKEQKKVKFIGITTSHGRGHGEFEKIMKTKDLDFIQLTYNIEYREVESRLLPLAKEKGIAVIANRPLDGGHLFSKVKGKPLPKWASDFQIENWSQYFLKFVVSHPSMTCAIPATSKVEHMKENMGACYGNLPDAAAREKMIKYLETV